MTDQEFLNHAEHLLTQLELACDHLNDHTSLDIDNQRVGSMITLTLANHSQIVAIKLIDPFGGRFIAAREGVVKRIVSLKAIGVGFELQGGVGIDPCGAYQHRRAVAQRLVRAVGKGRWPGTLQTHKPCSRIELPQRTIDATRRGLRTRDTHAVSHPPSCFAQRDAPHTCHQHRACAVGACWT